MIDPGGFAADLLRRRSGRPEPSSRGADPPCALTRGGPNAPLPPLPRLRRGSPKRLRREGGRSRALALSCVCWPRGHGLRISSDCRHVPAPGNGICGSGAVAAGARRAGGVRVRRRSGRGVDRGIRQARRSRPERRRPRSGSAASRSTSPGATPSAQRSSRRSMPRIPAISRTPIWHFLCVARASRSERARAGLLKAGPDSRILRQQIYEMAGGQRTPGTASRSGHDERRISSSSTDISTLACTWTRQATVSRPSTFTTAANERYDAYGGFMNVVAKVYVERLRKLHGNSGSAFPVPGSWFWFSSRVAVL